jgi:hypothetical protein
MTRALVTIRSTADREKCARWAKGVPVGTRVEWKAPRRSLDQNALLWARLSEIARQVEWYGQKLTETDWKDMFTASLRKARVVPGIDPGTFVVLGMHTSDMGKEEFGNLLDLIDAFAAERGVIFQDSDLSRNADRAA